jgi:hypothetical protein
MGSGARALDTISDEMLRSTLFGNLRDLENSLEGTNDDLIVNPSLRDVRDGGGPSTSSGWTDEVVASSAFSCNDG